MDVPPLPPTPRAPIQAPRGGSAEQIRQAAEQFEAVFLSELLGPMFEGLKTDGIGGGGAGERAFRPMLVQEYAKAIAKHGGVGVADLVARELTRIQSGQSDV